jgi:L-aspartate oxidase
MNIHGMSTRQDDVIIVGSGIGGLACALSMAPRSVTVVTKTPRLEGGSSLWAQGGIAAAVGPGDSPEAHAEDTLSAGAGLSNPERARHLTEEGAASLDWLINEGIPFDRDLDGELALAKEGAHQFARVAHAGGDTTGYVMMQSLIERVVATPSINVLDDTFALDLVVDDGRVAGLVTFNKIDGWVLHRAPVVVLATGGIGMAWQRTTNPVEATGDGLAMAARAGANLADLEFMQFHPTALAANAESDGASLPLLTEALRGAGALLLDESGQRFMPAEHQLAELAPRDVVARAIQNRIREGQQVFLDIRPVLESEHGNDFPTAVQYARDAGLDPYLEPLPVVPAAHYHMGGIQVDENGRASIDGLWACGEVSTTGIHGANRLASNSLLEALVFARRAAADILDCSMVEPAGIVAPPVPAVGIGTNVAKLVSATRELMSREVGIVRTGKGLKSVHSQLAAMQRGLPELATAEAVSVEQVRAWGEARNIVLIARLVTYAALQRKESRGAHYRRDFPEPKQEWCHPLSLTVERLSLQ